METTVALKKLTLGFASLVIITLTSLAVAEANWFAGLMPKAGVESLIILFASAKMVIVGDIFMELNHAPRWLRGTMAAWIAVVTLILIGINCFMLV